MIERLVYIALAQGIADAQADPRLVTDYFRKVKRIEEQTELDAIEQHFREKPPTIIHQYARAETKFPCWAIVLQTDDETTSFLGDQGETIGDLGDDGEDTPGGWIDPDDPFAGHEELAAIFTKRVQVFTYAEHPDVTVAYYHLSRFFLFRARELFKAEAEALGIRFRGGDILPDPRYIPGHLFVRQVTVEVEMPERMVGAKPARAFKVAGLHVPIASNDPTPEARITVVEE